MNPSSIVDLVRLLLQQFGPGGDPPELMVTDVLGRLRCRAPSILRLLHEKPNDGIDRLTGLVIAYGLRWSRHGGRGAGAGWPGPWDGVWDAPRRWLEKKVFGCMLRASRYLEFALRVEGYAFGPHPELEPAVTSLLVTWLVDGGCLCPQLALQGGSASADSNFLRRSVRCVRDHQIAGWNPERSSFFAFVCQAIKGAMPARENLSGAFGPKSLAQGMHFWNLYRLCDLRLADALVWICPEDASLNFEDQPCLKCLESGRGGAMQPNAFRTTVSRLLVPAWAGGRYQDVPYWHCQHCHRITRFESKKFWRDHYYPEDLRTCPKCGLGRTRGVRRSRVYLLDPPKFRVVPGGFENAGGLANVPDPSWNVSAEWPAELLTASGTELSADSALLEGLYRALNRLVRKRTATERELVFLRFTRKRTPVEVAARMKLRPGEVKKMEARLMAELRAELQSYLKEEDEIDTHRS